MHTLFMKAAIRRTAISSLSSFPSYHRYTLSSTNPTLSCTMMAKKSNTRLWIDTDVGFDDCVAISCCCGAKTSATDVDSVCGEINNSRRTTGIAGISTVGGGLTSDAIEGVTILRKLLFSLDDDDDDDEKVVVIPGRIKKNKTSTMKPDPLWLSKCRKQMKVFCSLEGIALSKSIGDDHGNTNSSDASDDDDDDAATTFLSTVMLPTSKIDLICLGPLTNLAHWLEHIPDFASDRLNSVWILGGNIPSGTSTTSNYDNAKEGHGVEAEFNFARDPEAVRKILNHPGLFGKTIHIVPQEVCNRDAFERSFYGSTATNISAATAAATAVAVADDTSTTITASEIIVDWLTTDKNTPVSSLLPSWMVRLIRTRSFSLYGDPICIYVRNFLNNNTTTKFNHDATDSDSDNDETKIVWKNYYSGSIGNTVDDVIEVDSHGRLLTMQSVKNTIASTARSVPLLKNDDRCTDDENVINNLKVDDSNIDNDTHNDRSKMITIRMVHEVDLGPAYLDWLKVSLTTTVAVES